MIHLLKQTTKPVGTAYKRRLVAIASTPQQFEAAQNPPRVAARVVQPAEQQQVAQPNQEERKMSAQEQAANLGGEGMQVDAANEIRNAASAAESSLDNFRDMTHSLKKSTRNRTKTHQQD